MSSSQSQSVDSFDCKILEILQQSNRTTSDQIAQQIGLSPASVQRRIKRLREDNIIQVEVAVINPKVVGQSVTLIVQVKLERERLDLLESFKKDMKNNASVQQCYYVTGTADFILVVKARDMEDYEKFTHKAFFDNPNVRNFETSTVMDPVKVGLSVPIVLEEN